MTSPLISPPQLRLPQEDGERQATWLELFYDLIFVVAVAAIGTRFTTHISALGFLQALVLFIPIWWAWVGHTIYDTRFDTDDLFQRLCTFGMMLAAATMAITIPYTFEGQQHFFALSYIAARIFLFALYLRAYRAVPKARPIIALYLRGFGLGDGLWLIALLVPAPWCYLLWMGGMCISFATPWIGLSTLKQAPVDTSHVPGRFASFTIIMIGEIISVTTIRVTSAQLHLEPLLAFLLAFCLTACIWWLYFTFLTTIPVKSVLSSGQPFIYAHLPLLFGLFILSVGLEHAVEDAERALFANETLWLLGIGLVLWLVAGQTLKLVMFNRFPSKRIIVRIGAICSVVLIIALGKILSPLLILLLLFIVLACFVAFESMKLSKTTNTN